MTNNALLAVVGPTASGKTSLAVEIAKKFNGEIVSCDSMQVYKGLPISTAQPTKEEMQGVKHHLIGFLDAKVNFSVGEYQNLARDTIKDIQKRGILPILCGGTGLYADSVIYNMDLASVGQSEQIRCKYTEYYNKKGAQSLYGLLFKKTPETAKSIHPNNINRVIRALEVYDLTGQSKKEYYNSSMKQMYYENTLLVGTIWERNELYERINKRVDIMIENGLAEEIKSILNYGVKPGNTAFKAIGCKELYEFFKGQLSFNEAVEKIKQYSRNYAKRQITWFKRISEINWLNYSSNSEIQESKTKIFKKIENIYF